MEVDSLPVVGQYNSWIGGLTYSLVEVNGVFTSDDVRDGASLLLVWGHYFCVGGLSNAGCSC